MSRWTLRKALELALSMERKSIELYTSAQTKALSSSSIRLLKELVREEQKHRNKIQEAMKDPKKINEIGQPVTKIQDLKIVDYLEDATLSPEADYQQILIYAGKREKETHDMYIELARKCRGRQIGKMFVQLAEEELKHKHRLEKEYDDTVLKYM
ncbi:hypothetical protein GTO27_12545 [Candidatus Bathyarchaeota archaeon]|nr:hypothetical protein [Candidatus Bathyarchaeota archaeon]